MKKTKYMRPREATLIVRTEDGEEWEATVADLDQFGYARRLDIYVRCSDLLLEALGISDYEDDSPAQHLSYLIECGVMYEHSPWADEEGNPWTGEDASDTKAVLRQALGGADSGSLKEG